MMSVNAVCGYEVYSTETGPRCCSPITCDPGHEAVMCQEGEPLSSDCRKCAHNTFRSDYSVLGRNDRCHFKQLCEGQRMTYLFPGNETADSICTCEPGFILTSDGHLCLPAPPTTSDPDIVPSPGDDSTPMPPPATAPDNLPAATVAVAVLCGLLAVVLVLVLALYLWKRRRRRETSTDVTDSKVMYYRVSHGEGDQLLYEKVASVKDFKFHAEVIDSKAMEVLESRLGRSLGPFLRQLYRQMGQAEAATRILDELQLEPVPEERAHRALETWRQAAGRSANVEYIRQALLVVNRKDLVDELYAWIVEQPSLVRTLDEIRTRPTDENKNINNRAQHRISADNGVLGTEV